MDKLTHEIPGIISILVKKYITEWDEQPISDGKIYQCKSAFDINNGLCDNFSEDLISLLGGENENQFILSDNMFLACDYKEAILTWGLEDLIKTNNGCAWSRKMLTLYSFPKIERLKSFEYLPSHVWVCINSKHYDAENPDGVNTPWDLKIFKNWITSLG